MQVYSWVLQGIETAATVLGVVIVVFPVRRHTRAISNSLERLHVADLSGLGPTIQERIDEGSFVLGDDNKVYEA